MIDTGFRLDYHACKELLTKRLGEPAPGRIQLLAGPRQVGKTTLLLELARDLAPSAVYAAADAPDAALPGFWERLLTRVDDAITARRHAVLLLDEAHLLPDWSARLKGAWDRYRRHRSPVQIVATGSSALHLAAGSRESLAGRFERLTLAHWSTSSVASAFDLKKEEAAEVVVRLGSYPGAIPLRRDLARWVAYMRDAIIEPAIGRDILALASVRRPALLRQIFGLAASSPAQILSLQKIQGQLQDAGALETIAHYLALLEEAFLVAAVTKHATRVARQRASPPKLVTLNNALIAAVEPGGPPDKRRDPARFGALVENACLAYAWNAGQTVTYWREEPLEVDGVIEGSWGQWAIEVKTGGFQPKDLSGLLEFAKRYKGFRPLVVCGPGFEPVAARADVAAITWQEFLLQGPPGAPELPTPPTSG